MTGQGIVPVGLAVTLNIAIANYTNGEMPLAAALTYSAARMIDALAPTPSFAAEAKAHYAEMTGSSGATVPLPSKPASAGFWPTSPALVASGGTSPLNAGSGGRSPPATGKMRSDAIFNRHDRSLQRHATRRFGRW